MGECGNNLCHEKSGYPFSMYGLNADNWQRVVVESVVFTLPVLAIIVFIKWILVNFTPIMAGEPVFDLCASHNQSAVSIFLSSLAHCVFTPIQEFAARGGVQGAFTEFLTGKHKDIKALLIANLLFSMTHIHISIVIVFVVFLPGLFWGWRFMRQHSLIGISISHIIVGLFVFTLSESPLSNSIYWEKGY